MTIRLYLRCCSWFFLMKHRRFRIIFPILLGVISLLSSALVFHVLRRMARTVRYKSFAYQIGVAFTYTKNNVDLRHMEENIINSNAACKLPVLDPFHSSVIHFIKDVGKLRCSGVSYSSFENNVLRVEGEDIVSAQYRKIERTPRNDFGVVLSDPVKVQITSRGRVAAKIPKGKQNIIVFFFCEVRLRALLLTQFSARTSIAWKEKWHQYCNHFVSSMTALSVLFFLII